jgi:CheY-like chemotaxis protein
MVRQGLRRALEEHGELAVVGEAGDGFEAIAMAQLCEPDVVVMDVDLPGLSGIEATRRIVRERPTTIVIGLSFGGEAFVTEAMKAAGAVGCVMKERAAEDVYEAILAAVEMKRAAGRARLFFAFPAHVPRRRADELLFARHHEAELLVEFYVLRFVGFEIARRFFLPEMLDIAVHQRPAHALSLHLRRDAERPEVDVRLVGVQTAPARKPLDEARFHFAQRA